MFFLIIGGLFTSVQIYLLLKSHRFVKELFPIRWKTPGTVLLIVFFLWVNAPALLAVIFGRSIFHLPEWKMYVFLYPFFVWSIASLFMVGIYIVKDLLILFGKGFKKVFYWYLRQLPSYNPVKHETTGTVLKPGRRKFLHIASAGLAVPPLVMSTYGILYGSRNYYVNNVELHFPQLPENLRGLKIVQFSDIHCSQYTPQEDIGRAVKIINEANADLVLLTGDFVPMDVRYIYPCVEALKILRGKYGVFASLGNHEEWTDPVLVTKTLEQNGIPVLRNAGTTLAIRDEKLNLLGVDDSRWGRADLPRALSMVPPDNFNLLMSHQPPFWDVANKKRIDLTLAGHTHGGQIALTLLGGKFSFGQLFHKYNEGVFKNGNTQLFVSTGFGFTGPPIRFNVPPEIVVITLT